MSPRSKVFVASVEAGEHLEFTVTQLSSRTRLLSFGLLSGFLVFQACSASDSGGGDGSGNDSDGGGSDSDGGIDGGTDGGGLDSGIDGGTDGGGTDGGDDDNPTTCAQAQSSRSYIGCEFWPTITYNPVYTEFDFAVVLANGGSADANVTVEGNGQNITETVPAGGLKAILLPWNNALKGPEFSRTNTQGGRATASALVPASAYKVTSSVPVTAWQFNPLQYKKAMSELGGAQCGTQFGTADCYSASNDATLLLPTSAMTPNYRAFTRAGIYGGAPGLAYTSASSGIAITATQDNTTVEVQLSPTCAAETWNGPGDCLAAGSGVTAGKANDIKEFTLNAGDVLQLLGTQAAGDTQYHADLSGSVIVGSAPIQVIGFNPITNIPDIANADHVEEIILPGEVLGKEYIVAVPTSPSGVVKGGHVVRFYGNVDGTQLTYENQPAGAPTTIDAGDVVEIGPLTSAFKVTGTEPFAIGTFMIGGAGQGDGACPNFPCSGDPAFSIEVTPEQFRKQYTFLAPNDYDVNYADILVPDGASVTLDGAPVSATEPVVAGWSLARVRLDGGAGGAHRLASDKAVGLQVMGFGHATSYYYPGGLNLKLISRPPSIPR